jgi:anti-anti-sigma factor
MTARSTAGIQFRATPVAHGAAIRIDLPEENLDFDAADGLKSQLHDTLSAFLAEGYRSFILDLSTVQRIDSCGVGLLIGMHHQVVAKGGTLVVAVQSPFVRKVLRWMRLDRFLDLETTVERALRNVADVM